LPSISEMISAMSLKDRSSEPSSGTSSTCLQRLSSSSGRAAAAAMSREATVGSFAVAVDGRGEDVKTRILEAAAELLARSADADISTRVVGEAAGVTPPTLYHHFGEKEGLLAVVVDFGWTAFLESKRTTAAVVHEHVADDIRAGWHNHLEFARENPNFYRLIWSPAISVNSTAFRQAFQMLYDRLEFDRTEAAHSCRAGRPAAHPGRLLGQLADIPDVET